MTTELNSLSSGSTATSSVYNSTGVVQPTNLSNYPNGLAELVAGSGSNMTASSAILGWWLNSVDGGSNYESTAQAQVRAPDFVWVVTASTAQRLFCNYNAPLGYAKLCIQNNSGQGLSSSGNTVKLLPGTTQIPNL